MSIATEITRLQGAKADIKTAIENVGITVPANATLDNYDTYIGQMNDKFLEVVDGSATTISAANLYGLTEIRPYGFYKSTDLTSITIPSTVTKVGTYAFGESGLTSINIPNTVTNLGASVCYECSDLVSATIGTGLAIVRTTGAYAFYKCTSLTTVNLPNNLQEIGACAFKYCRSLTSITIPSTVSAIRESAFYSSGLTSITVPDNVVILDNDAFGACSSLTSVVLGTGVSTIKSSVFTNDTSLSSLTLKRSSVVTLEAFSAIPLDQNITVYVPSNLISSYQSADKWSTLYNSGDVTFVAITE